MTVSLCIRQGSKRNDDSVSVEELDWSAESQVLIPAEHLWCDFKCRPGAKNSSPNTNDLYIHYMDKSVTRDEVEDSNAEEIRVFNNKVKQKNINHPEGGKTSRQAEDWSTVKHLTHMTWTHERQRISTGLQTQEII